MPEHQNRTMKRADAQFQWIPTAHEDRIRELSVANYYLCMRPEALESAQVEERDFTAVPSLGVWMTKARGKQDLGEPWSIVDVAIGGFDQGTAEFNGWQRGKPLLDWVLDTTSYVGSQVRAMERAMVERAMLRDVVVDLGVVHQAVRVGEASADDVLERLTKITDRLRTRNTAGWVRHAEAVEQAALAYAHAVRDGVSLTLPMPWQGLQDAVEGWPLGRLIMIQAITSGHKTTAGRQAAEHVANLGTASTYITFEDPPKHIAARSMAAASGGGFSVRDIMTGKGTDTIARNVIEVADRMIRADIPMTIRHQKMTLPQLITRLHEAAAKDCKLAVVDFFQLLLRERRGEDPTEFFARAGNAIQGAAESTGMCVILLVQPTQEATKRVEDGGHVLGLGDMRGGSAISQAAFGVLSLAFEYDEQSRRAADWIMVYVRKWKTASTAAPVRLRLDAAHDSIRDPEDGQAALAEGKW